MKGKKWLFNKKTILSKCRMKWNAHDSVDTNNWKAKNDSNKKQSCRNVEWSGMLMILSTLIIEFSFKAKMTLKTLLSTVGNELSAMMECSWLYWHFVPKMSEFFFVKKQMCLTTIKLSIFIKRQTFIVVQC